MSTRGKGGTRERQCVKALERAGWKAHKKVNNTYDNSDIWGLFDVIATKKGEKPLYIQVKSNTTDGALKQIKNKEFLNPEHMNIQVWVAHDYNGWRVKKLEEEEWKQPVDERKNSRKFGEEVVELYA